MSSHDQAMFPVPPMDSKAACKSCSPHTSTLARWGGGSPKGTSRRGKGSAPLRNRVIGAGSFGRGWAREGRFAASARPSLDSASNATRGLPIQLAVQVTKHQLFSAMAREEVRTNPTLRCS